MTSTRLDHFAWASPSLDQAITDVEALTGVRAAPGGSHPGKGTRNAILSLGPGLYVALDGPDPAQPLVANNGAWMAGLASPVLFLFAVATDDIAGAQAVLARQGVATSIGTGERLTRDGRRLAWQFLAGKDDRFGIALPHVVRWLTDHHPSTDGPAGCRLADFAVRHPQADRVRDLYGALGLEIAVSQGATVDLTLTLDGSRGRVTLPSRIPADMGPF